MIALEQTRQSFSNTHWQNLSCCTSLGGKSSLLPACHRCLYDSMLAQKLQVACGPITKGAIAMRVGEVARTLTFSGDCALTVHRIIHFPSTCCSCVSCLRTDTVRLRGSLPRPGYLASTAQAQAKAELMWLSHNRHNPSWLGFVLF